MATLGGNLLERPRCWYFRSAGHHCARKGGTVCFAFAGENQHHAIFDHRGCAIVHPSTPATALVALGAKVEIATGQGGKQEMALEDFFVLPQVDVHRENDLKPGKILTAITLPALAATVRSVHVKQGERDSFDWPIADVAVVLDLTERSCKSAAIALGAVAPEPRSLLLWAIGSTTRVHRRRPRRWQEQARKNAYKVPIVETLVRRAILAAVDSA